MRVLVYNFNAPSSLFRLLSFIHIIRPPNTHVGGIRFYRGFYLSCFRSPAADLGERNSTKIGHMHARSEVTAIWKCMSIIWGIPLQIGGPKATFLGLFRNLTATLTAYIFGMKDDIVYRSSALTTTRGLLQRP